MRFKKPAYATTFSDSDHTPLVAIWYQTRRALAEFLVPMIAGLTTVWFIIFSPRKFFNICFHPQRATERLHSPLGVFWRLLTSEERKPLEAAQFLLFGIFTAALGGFQFDNSNRLLGFLQRSGATESVTTRLLADGGRTADMITAVQQALSHPILQATQDFFDQTIIAGLMELVTTLFVTMFFAFLFYFLVGRKLSVVNSYSFWLYMAGLQFFTTGISAILLTITSASFFGLPEIAPNLFFWLQEAALRFVWQFLFPALVLPRLVAELSVGRVLLASLVARGVLAGAGWLLLGGIYTVLALLGSL